MTVGMCDVRPYGHSAATILAEPTTILDAGKKVWSRWRKAGSMADDERRAFVDVDAGIAETVRAIDALVERWPANDAQADALADTLRFLSDYLEQGLPLRPPSASELRALAEQRAKRTLDRDDPDDEEGWEA